MKDESKKGIFKRLLGQKSSCCCFDIEEIETTEQKSSDSGDDAPNGCCCLPSKPVVKRAKTVKSSDRQN